MEARGMRAAAALLCALASVCATQHPCAVWIEGYGRVIGSLSERGICAYRGIPYAAPPVGPLRWRRPQPVRPGAGPLVATAFGRPCPSQLFAMTTPAADESEDCLTINVFVPAVTSAAAAAPPAAGRPVTVFVHGGGFVSGSSADPYVSPHSFAHHAQSVYVSFNYRLGALGTFAHRGTVATERTANFALHDKVAAFRWVRKHIAVFG
jgi:para-nitrobenzyl esterase